MDSRAWLSLSAHAQALWCHIRRRYNSFNNGDIPLLVREASERLHCGKAKAQSAFDELMDKGFIKIGEDSSFNRKTKRSRRWILTDVVYQETSPTNEWKSWKI